MWTKQRHVEQQEIRETKTDTKTTFWGYFTKVCEHTAGLTASVMKRALSVRPITSDWCSWVADWWQAAKRRGRRSSACQRKEQFVCVFMHVVEIRGTDSLQLGVKTVRVCASCLTQLDILTMLMRDQQRTIGEFHADFVQSRWHSMCCSVLTK